MDSKLGVVSLIKTRYILIGENNTYIFMADGIKKVDPPWIWLKKLMLNPAAIYNMGLL